MDTHVNAYYANVEEKKQAVVQAQSELEAAQLLLKSKLAETNVAPVDTSQASGETSVTPTEEEVDSASDKSTFSKKK